MTRAVTCLPCGAAIIAHWQLFAHACCIAAPAIQQDAKRLYEQFIRLQAHARLARAGIIVHHGAVNPRRHHRGRGRGGKR